MSVSIQQNAGVNAVLSAVTFDVPEPACLGLLALGGAGVLRRRRRG
jgi:hypothetical protein